MKEMKKLKNKIDILNSEGTILGLYNNKEKKILCVYLQNKVGNLYFPITKNQIADFINSEVTIEQLFETTNVYELATNKETINLSKVELINLLPYKNKYYNEIPSYLKSNRIIEFLNK